VVGDANISEEGMERRQRGKKKENTAEPLMSKIQLGRL